MSLTGPPAQADSLRERKEKQNWRDSVRRGPRYSVWMDVALLF